MQLMQLRLQHTETAAAAAETSSCSLKSGLAIAHIQAASGQKRTNAYIVQSPLDGRNETKLQSRETVQACKPIDHRQ